MQHCHFFYEGISADNCRGAKDGVYPGIRFMGGAVQDLSEIFCTAPWPTLRLRYELSVSGSTCNTE